MGLIYLDTYTMTVIGTETKRTFPNRDEAMQAAADRVGNWSSTRLGNDEYYLFGPGDGSATVSVRRDFTWERDEHGNLI